MHTNEQPREEIVSRELTLITSSYGTRAVCGCGWESYEYKSKKAAEQVFKEHLAEPNAAHLEGPA